MGTSKENIEKRIFQRIDVEFPVGVRDPRTNKVISGKCRDVAAGGISLVTDKQVLLKRNLIVEFRLPDERQPYSVRASGIWNKEIKDGLWQMGLSFKDINLLKHWRIFRLPGVRKPIF